MHLLAETAKTPVARCGVFRPKRWTIEVAAATCPDCRLAAERVDLRRRVSVR